LTPGIIDRGLRLVKSEPHAVQFRERMGALAQACRKFDGLWSEIGNSPAKPAARRTEVDAALLGVYDALSHLLSLANDVEGKP
jgi:hypothetical protein